MRRGNRVKMVSVFALIAILETGCAEYERYLDRSDGISPSAGDAMYANRAIHRVGRPVYPPLAGERITIDGKRTVPIIENYHIEEGAEEQPPASPPIQRQPG